MELYGIAPSLHLNYIVESDELNDDDNWSDDLELFNDDQIENVLTEPICISISKTGLPILKGF
jgi:hypothetical protein